MIGCLSQASSTPTARATSTSMGAGRTSPWWITVSAACCLSASALICAVVHHETLRSDCCLPFVLGKKKGKWCLWYSFHCPLMLSLREPHCIHVRHLKRAICISLWNTEQQSFRSSSSLLHITASVITCVYLRMEILLPTDELFLKTHNFVFLTRLPSPRVFKTSDCFSQCTFFESK